MVSGYRRRGVTIAETLMVGAIGAAMLGLLLPAISAAIANAQGSHCRNNLARFGTALGTYHDAFGRFPPGGQIVNANEPVISAAVDESELCTVRRPMKRVASPLGLNERGGLLASVSL